MRKFIISSIVSVLSVSGLQAQEITGRIIDKAGKAVPYANVVLLSKADSSFVKGTVSDTEGHFVIPADTQERLLKVSCIGYQTKYLTASTSPGTIQLTEDAHTLGSLTVRGNRPLFRNTAEGVLTTVEGTLLAKSGTAEDVLKRLPGVRKTSEGYEVLGKGTPLIYLNGKKLQRMEELDRLKSEDIKQVEVLLNPGAEYEAGTNAVLRIKTVRKAGEGFGLDYRQVYMQAHQAGHQEEFNWNYRKNGFDLFGMLYYGDFADRQEQWGSQLIDGGKTLSLINSLLINSRVKQLEGTVGMNYEWKGKHYAGVTYTGVKPTEYKGGWNADMTVSSHGNTSEKIHNLFTLRGKNQPSHDIAAYYSGTFGKVSVDWNGNIYLRKDGNTQRSEETGVDSRTVLTDYNTDGHFYATKLTASTPLWKGNLKLGAEYTAIDRKNLYQVKERKGDVPGDTDNQSKEKNTAAFVSYGFGAGNFQAEAGVRYEHVVFDYYNHGVRSADESRVYDNLFPNLSVAYLIGKVNVQLNYTAKCSRPSFAMLSGNVQYNDRYTFQEGNPLLRPTTRHTTALTLSYQWIRLATEWRYFKDASYQMVEAYGQNPDITVYTFRNMPHYQAVYTSLSLSPRIGFWQPMWEAALKKQWFKVKETAFVRTYNKPICYLTFRNTFRLPWELLLNVDMDYATKGHSTSIWWEKTWGLNVSLYKEFWHKRLSVNLQGQDLFASYRGTNRMDYGNRNIYKWNYADTRKFVLTLRYTFNTANDRYKGTGAGESEKGRL